ncbi:MAG: 30S ribosomal protein S16 [bacterium]
MLQIKLSRIGKKKMPTYRLVILEKGRDPYGNTLEILGNYNPRAKKGEFKIDRIKYWLSKGAQTTDTVTNLFIANKIIEGKTKKSYKIKKSKLKNQSSKPQIKS